MLENNANLIIVHTDKRNDIASFMAQLIHIVYPDLSVAVWEEKNWKHNRPQLESSQKVIFIGSTGDKNSTGIKWQYDYFSMKYGWLGKQCVVDVKTLKPGKIKEFHTYYDERSKYFNEKMKELSISRDKHEKDADFAVHGGDAIIKTGGVVGGIVGGLLFTPLTIAVYATHAIVINSMKKYQYRLLVCEFVLEGGLKKFAGE